MVVSNAHRTSYVRWLCMTLSAVGLAVLVVSFKTGTSAEAKTPGKTYCYHGVCHRVKTIAETKAMIGKVETIVASHYDDCRKDRYNPCGLTSSGEVFRPNAPDNTASPIYPDGTKLLVWNPATERALVVRVNNAGPYHRNRKLDLSRGAAAKLGFAGQGVAKLHVKVVGAPTPAEAKYSKKRRYPPVLGDIGTFASVEQADTGMQVALAALENKSKVTDPSLSTPPTVVASLDDDLGVDDVPHVFGRSGFAAFPVTTHRKVVLFDPDLLADQSRIGEGLPAQTITNLASLGIGSPLYQSQKGDLIAGAPPASSEKMTGARLSKDAKIAMVGSAVQTGDESAKAVTESEPAAQVKAAEEAKPKKAPVAKKASTPRKKRAASKKSTSRKSSSRSRSSAGASRRSSTQVRRTAAVAKKAPRKVRSTADIMANAIADRHRHAL